MIALAIDLGYRPVAEIRFDRRLGVGRSRVTCLETGKVQERTLLVRPSGLPTLRR